MYKYKSCTALQMNHVFLCLIFVPFIDTWLVLTNFRSVSFAGEKKSVGSSIAQIPMPEKVGKTVKQPLQRKDSGQVSSSVAASEKRVGDRQQEKDRKKDAPAPRMQFDDTNRVEKAKKRAVFKQTEARNRVELFRHLPQYEHGSQLPDLESKFFYLDPMHPSVYKVLFCTCMKMCSLSAYFV